VAPLIGRYEVPAGWRCVVAVPPGKPGLSGEAEASAFAQLPPPAEGEAERVSHLVLMQLLPALVQGDLKSFGAALSEIQRITGAWFAPQQGGVFAPGPGEALIRNLAEWGAAGVGQSSWGPAVYGLVDGDEAAAALAGRCREFLGGRGLIFQSRFARFGARMGLGGPPSGND
jgi:beta-RFAP synthase